MALTESRGSASSVRDLLRPLRGALGAALLLTMCASGLAVAQPLLLRAVVDSVGSATGATTALLGLVAVTLTEAALRGIQTYLVQDGSESFVLSLRRGLVRHVLRLPIPAYGRLSRGDLVGRLGTDTTMVRQVMAAGLLSVVSGGLLVSAALVMMAGVDAVLLGLTVGMLALVLIVIAPVMRSVRGANDRYQSGMGEAAERMDAALSAVRLLRSYGAGDQYARSVEATAERVRREGRHLARLTALVEPVVDVATQGALLLVLAVGGARVAAGALTIGDLVAFLLYLVMVVMPLSQLTRALTQIQAGRAALGRIQQVTRLGAERQGGNAVPPSVDSGPAPVLVLEHVSYEHALGAGVRSVDVAFVPDGYTAIVGASGAGKSTVLALLAGLIDPAQGAVRFRGDRVADLDLVAYRRRVHLVEQSAPVLAGSLRQNLALAAPEADDAALAVALTSVGLDHLLRRPGGMDQRLGDGGLTMSGGERQRLAWARLLLDEREVLLLDEPTSHVDPAAAARFATLITAMPRGRTVVLVTHDLELARAADQVVVLDRGRVVGAGEHDRLLATCPAYRDLSLAAGGTRVG